jgi:hypothetical protein
MMSGWRNKKTGLTWGDKPEVSTTGKVSGGSLTYLELPYERITGGANPSQYNITNSTTVTGSNGETTQQLTDIIGERVITVEARVTFGGTDYTASQTVSFGTGPLVVFKAPVGTSSGLTWKEAYKACNGTEYNGTDPSNWNQNDVVGGSGMMKRVEYQAVSAYNVPSNWTVLNPNTNAQGAAVAAGWPDTGYWRGEAYGVSYAFLVNVPDGNAGNGDSIDSHQPVACRR